MPSAFAPDDSGDDARFPIDAGMNILDVRKAHLHLVDGQSTLDRPPGQQVYRPTLSVVVEGVLNDHLPARRSVEPHGSFDQGGVASVQKLGTIHW
jgi:hypothetical protein